MQYQRSNKLQLLKSTIASYVRTALDYHHIHHRHTVAHHTTYTPHALSVVCVCVCTCRHGVACDLHCTVVSTIKLHIRTIHMQGSDLIKQKAAYTYIRNYMHSGQWIWGATARVHALYCVRSVCVCVSAHVQYVHAQFYSILLAVCIYVIA